MVVVVNAGAVVVVVAPRHIPLAQIWSGPQQSTPQQICPTEELQHALVHSCVPAGQKHSHVVALKLAPGLQAMHRLVAGQRLLPLGQAHLPVAGSQNPPQHSELWRHRCPTSLHRAPCAPLVPNSDTTPPRAIAASSLTPRRRQTDVPSPCETSSNPCWLMTSPPWHAASTLGQPSQRADKKLKKGFYDTRLPFFPSRRTAQWAVGWRPPAPALLPDRIVTVDRLNLRSGAEGSRTLDLLNAIQALSCASSVAVAGAFSRCRIVDTDGALGPLADGPCYGSRDRFPREPFS